MSLFAAGLLSAGGRAFRACCRRRQAAVASAPVCNLSLQGRKTPQFCCSAELGLFLPLKAAARIPTSIGRAEKRLKSLWVEGASKRH